MQIEDDEKFEEQRATREKQQKYFAIFCHFRKFARWDFWSHFSNLLYELKRRWNSTNLPSYKFLQNVNFIPNVQKLAINLSHTKFAKSISNATYILRRKIAEHKCHSCDNEIEIVINMAIRHLHSSCPTSTSHFTNLLFCFASKTIVKCASVQNLIEEPFIFRTSCSELFKWHRFSLTESL